MPAGTSGASASPSRTSTWVSPRRLISAAVADTIAGARSMPVDPAGGADRVGGEEQVRPATAADVEHPLPGRQPGGVDQIGGDLPEEIALALPVGRCGPVEDADDSCLLVPLVGHAAHPRRPGARVAAIVRQDGRQTR